MKKTMAIMLIGLFLVSSIPMATAAQPKLSMSNQELKVVGEYNQLKQNYLKVKGEWQDSRVKYLVAKEKLKKFDQLSIEEQDIHFGEAKKFTLKTIEKMKGYVDILQSWNERITNNLEINIELKEILIELESFQKSVESASNVEELKEVNKKLKTYWTDKRVELKKITGKILSAKVNKVLTKAENLSSKLHAKIDSLDQTSEEVIEMQNILKKLDIKLNNARKEYDKAVNTYSQINSLKSVNNSLKDVKEYLKASNAYLKEAHKDLKHLVKLYRANQGSFPTLTAQTQ